MRLVLLAYLHGFGGAEKQIVMLANAMADRGHDVTLISISADNNCYKLNEGVDYLSLPDRCKGILRIGSRYIDIWKTLRCIKPDITVNYWFQSAYMTAMMKKSVTGKVVYSERGDPGDREYSGVLGLIRRLTLPRIDAFVFQSNAAKGYFDKRVQARSVVIPNPVLINAEPCSESETRRKSIVTIGRLHPQKNQRLLIDAFAMVAKGMPDYSLEIYGDGDLKEELQQRIRDLGLSNRAFLKGTSTHIHKLIRDASLFVLSSNYEGLPNTLLEAMALGIPVISTDYKPGGVSEIIEHGRNGWIAKRGDAESLAALIAHAIENRSDSARVAEKGKVDVSKLAPNLVYGKWNEFFKLLSNGEL